ncbi:MAG TPA: imidazole glycerol phosphate synthase subunit HisH, partial [Anaerolineae bacterium]
MIAIIDYGMGNLRSAQRGLEKVGAEVRVVQSPRELSGVRGLVLPGDGAFGRAIENLRSAGWIEPLCNAAAEGMPFFGICVGMQLLFDSSEEMGQHRGLGLFAGSVKRFTGNLKVPHMGWNQIRISKTNADSSLLRGVADGGYCYFVHSYYCAPQDSSISAATTDYGIEFASIVERGNIFGTQFHPEKSQTTGLK